MAPHIFNSPQDKGAYLAFAYRSQLPLREVRAGTQSKNLTQKPWRKASFSI